MATLDDFFRPQTPQPQEEPILERNQPLGGSLDAFFEDTSDPQDVMQERLRTANEANPDQVGRMEALARRLRMDPAMVAEDGGELERQERLDQQTQALQGADTLSTWMSEGVNAEMAHDDVETLGFFERISDGFRRGVAQVEFGQAQFTAIQDRSRQDRADVLFQRLQELGEDEGGGVASFFAESASIIGQMAETFNSPEALSRVAAGGATGAAVGGLAGAPGGPLAGLTAAGGAISGIGVGLASNLAIEAYENETGFAYREYLDAGMTPETAMVASTAVGVVNAALEMGGAALVAKPLVAGGKKLLRRKVQERLATPENARLVAQWVRDFGLAVGGEVLTEILQEATAVAGQEITAIFSDEEISRLSQEEIAERLADVAEKTFKGMILLGGVGATVNYAGNRVNAAEADRTQERLATMAQAAQESQLAERNPEAFGELAGRILEDRGQEEFFIPANQLQNWAQQTEQAGLLRELGVDLQMVEALQNGSDVRIPAAKFAQVILPNEQYELLSPHIRTEMHGFTPEEAAEWRELGLDNEANTFDSAALPEEESTIADPTQEPAVEEDGQLALQLDTSPEAQAVDIAEAELGLQALFRTAEEAGMTEKEYQRYLTNVQKKADDAANRVKDKRLAEEQRETTAEWKKQLQQEQEVARESLSQTDTYNSQQAVGPDRLDHAQVMAVLEEAGVSIDELPKAGRARLITNKGQAGVNIDAYAQQYEYADGEEMILDWLTAQPFDEAVEQVANQVILDRNGSLLDRLETVIAARAELHNDAQEQVLVAELNQLRKEKAAGRVSARLLRQHSKQQLERFPVASIQPEFFFAQEKRLAVKAARALRRNERGLAADLKFQQVVNHQMGRLAIKASQEIDTKVKFLRKQARPSKKAQTKIPVKQQEAIGELLGKTDLSQKRPANGPSALSAVENGLVDPIALTAQLRSENPPAWTNMRLQEFRNLHDTVKSIRKVGLDAEKLRKKEEALTLDFTTAIIATSVEQNLKAKNPLKTRNRFDRARKHGRDVMSMVLNIDTILREVDGFVDQGDVFSLIKLPHDKAISQGYNADQVGYTKRNAQESQVIRGLYEDQFDSKYMRQINTRKRIDGLGRKVSRNEVLSAILNWGNMDGRQNMISAEQFSEEQMDLLIDSLTEQEHNFLNSTWAYLDSFFEEIRTTEQRRRNYSPEKVEAAAFESLHGRLTGGYYPLNYNWDESFIDFTDNVADLERLGRQGAYIVRHTRRGHTEQRTHNNTKPVSLDLGVINTHIAQITWDLEMGDALQDSYKVLHAEGVRQAFQAQGWDHYWQAMELWLRDVTQGELAGAGSFQQLARWWRTGFVASKLAFNVGTIMVQPLGVVTTAAQVGKFNTFMGILRAQRKGVGAWIDEISPVMAARNEAHLADIALARNKIRNGFLKDVVGDKAAFIVAEGAFYGIKKMQRVVDRITFVAAYREGMKKFENDQEKTVLFAENMVQRAQGSAIFGQRTAVERGSTSIQNPQSELVRAWTPLMSYFISKNNVMIERAKRTSFKNPVELVDFMTDVVMVYWLEAIVAGLLVGRFPSEGDEEEQSFWAFEEGLLQIVSGIPVAREIAGALRGFFPGRTGAAGQDLNKVRRGIEKAEDEGLWNKDLREGVVNLVSPILRFPAVQFNRFADAATRTFEGDDVTIQDWLFGNRDPD